MRFINPWGTTTVLNRSNPKAIIPMDISFFILGQIAIIDIVFSLDSVITAVGLVDQLWMMATAVILAVMVMMFAAGPIGRFVSNHPTLKVLALSFLILIGVSLMADGLDFHIPKGYIYFAMAFSLIVEMFNSRLRKQPEP